MYSIGADIGGSHISTSLFEHSNKLLVNESFVFRKVNRLASKEEILSNWVDAILLTKKSISEDVKGIGLAMPGPFDYYNGISLIQGVDKFESLYKVNIRNELAQRLSFDPASIRFINDASAFTIAECLIGKAAKFSRCVGITLGTGLGSSFINRGMPILKSEDVPAGGFLYDKIYDGTQADDIFSSRGLIKSFYERSGISCESVLQVSSRVDSDLHARETFLHFGHELGKFLRPHLQKFNAEVLVLGGNICRAFHLFQQPLQQELSKFQLYVSNYGEKAAMIGAARLLNDNYYAQIEDSLKDM